MFLAPWSRSRLRKKTGVGAGATARSKKKTEAGAAKNMPLLYRLLDNKKHKELYICNSYLGKIVSFYGKNHNHFTCFIYLTVLQLVVCEEKIFHQT